MSYPSLVYSDIAVTSADGEISVGRHTVAISFHNTNDTTDAVVRLNGGPREVLIPANKNYVEIPGDFTKFQIITAGVTLAVFAIG